MRPFVVNGILWRPVMVEPSDERLTDRTGSLRLATTDPATRCVYLSRGLRGADLQTVLTHEVAHCVMYSHGLLESLHRIVPERAWVDVEEWVCNFIAGYGAEAIHAASTALGAPPVRRVP